MTILDLVHIQNKNRSCQLPLIASENRTSPAVDEILISDLQHRYAEGLPRHRLYPGTHVIDLIEEEAQEKMLKLFGAGYVDLRPLSGTQANLCLYTAFSLPGDTIMRLGTGAGGHISSGSRRLGGAAGQVRLLDTVPFAFDEEKMNIDAQESINIFNGLCKVKKTPKILLFGASLFLHPHPVKEIAEYVKACEPQVIIAYDAAHVAGLIAGGTFQDPFKEGADIITMSTHKTFPGPQHGCILGSPKLSEKLWRKVQKAVFPGNVSNHHLAAMAGVGQTAEEMLRYGNQYATAIIANAKNLAVFLTAQNFDVLTVNGDIRNATDSHQIAIKTPDNDGLKMETALEKSNILANKNMLPFDSRFGRGPRNPSGVRIGIQEVTRLGMKEEQMSEIATLIRQAVDNGTTQINRPELMAVQNLMKEYAKVEYC